MAQGAYESGAAPPQASSGYRPAPAAAYARPLAPNGPPVDDPYGEQGAPPALVECGQCGRKMTAKALGAHSKACGKVRKVFDAKAARVGGTEAAEFVLGRKAKEAEARAKAAADAAAKKSKWKEQSSAFRDAMKNARCDWRVCTRKRATVAACTRELPPSKRGGGLFSTGGTVCFSFILARAPLSCAWPVFTSPLGLRLGSCSPRTAAFRCSSLIFGLHVIYLQTPPLSKPVLSSCCLAHRCSRCSSRFLLFLLFRAVTQAIATGGPMPDAVPSAPDSSLVQCPHCARRFNEQAAERHIPKCNDIKAKPTALKAGSRKNIGSDARAAESAAAQGGGMRGTGRANTTMPTAPKGRGGGMRR